MISELRTNYREWWLKSSTASHIKQTIYCIMHRIYRFGDWNITTTINNRDYALDVVSYLNSCEMAKKSCTVVEVGCGLGEIIGNIDAKYRRGYDIDEGAIHAAKILHPSVNFSVGGFNDVCGCIDCLVMVNFIHIIAPDEIKKILEDLQSRSMIDMFVIDVFENNPIDGYQYIHTGKNLFGDDYYLLRRSRGFVAAKGARRHMEYWKHIGGSV